jgi:arginyl-tRNA synthetase
VREKVVEIVRAALARGASEGLWPLLEAPFTVEPPRDPRHGDFAVNAALVLAKPAGRAPRQIASDLAEVVRAVDEGRAIESLEIAGPGFLNLRLKTEVWLAALCNLAFDVPPPWPAPTTSPSADFFRPSTITS